MYKEKRRELAFEGGRMFEIQRLKQSVIRVDALSPQVQLMTYPSNKAIAPLPLSDVQGGLIQNADY